MFIHFLEAAAPFFAAQELKCSWLSFKEDPNWQYLFTAFGLTEVTKSIRAESKRKPAATETSTPPKKKKPTPEDSEMSPAKTSTAPKKVGQCRAANFGQPKKVPETLARAGVPVVTKEDGPFDPAADREDPEDPETIKKADKDLRLIADEPLVAPGKIFRKQHGRIAKKVTLPSAAVQLKTCKRYFGEIGALWPLFSKIHHRQGLYKFVWKMLKFHISP